uniref:Uncharacterized protein n=1 Tax=Arundo donax TaxID=35708 RepID=A0A0A8YRT6_ARUDO
MPNKINKPCYMLSKQ